MQYLRVRWRSVLDVEQQGLQDLPLLDQVCGVQSHVLVEDLKVLTHSKRTTQVMTVQSFFIFLIVLYLRKSPC